MVSFECDNCIYSKSYGRSPVTKNNTDRFSMACIHRVNLDAYWSRAKDTVDQNSRKVLEGLGPYLNPGPLLAHDHC